MVCFNDTLTAYDSLHLLRLSHRYVFGGETIHDLLLGKGLEEVRQDVIQSSTLAFV